MLTGICWNIVLCINGAGQCQLKKSTYKHQKIQTKSGNSHSVFERPTLSTKNSSFENEKCSYFLVPQGFAMLSFSFVHLGYRDHNILKECIYLDTLSIQNSYTLPPVTIHNYSILSAQITMEEVLLLTDLIVCVHEPSIPIQIIQNSKTDYHSTCGRSGNDKQYYKTKHIVLISEAR